MRGWGSGVLGVACLIGGWSGLLPPMSYLVELGALTGALEDGSDSTEAVLLEKKVINIINEGNIKVTNLSQERRKELNHKIKLCKIFFCISIMGIK